MMENISMVWPYDTEHLEKLMQWLAKNNYELAGDIIDVCLLDTTFISRNRRRFLYLCAGSCYLKNK